MISIPEFKVTKNCITIYDSYKIKTKADMNFILTVIKYNYSDINDDDYIFNQVNRESMINEWRGHNLLYNLHLFRSHTKDVDINKNPWYLKAGYWILSKLYF